MDFQCSFNSVSNYLYFFIATWRFGRRLRAACATATQRERVEGMGQGFAEIDSLSGLADMGCGYLQADLVVYPFHKEIITICVLGKFSPFL